MKKSSVILAALCLCAVASTLKTAAAQPRVQLQTSHGVIVLELDAERAPLSTQNFLTYVKDGFYEGTLFHRVKANFMIQGGGLITGMKSKPTRGPIKNEAGNGLKNLRGTVAMARTGNPHSATSQFFINVVNNKSLNHKAPSGRKWGYAVFGRVVEGMDVVDSIRKTKTGTVAGRRDVPLEPVIIQKASVLTAKDYVGLSAKYYRQGKFAKSIEAGEMALHLTPDNVSAYNNICVSNIKLKEWEKAIGACEKAIELAPDYKLARNNLTWARKEQARSKRE